MRWWVYIFYYDTGLVFGQQEIVFQHPMSDFLSALFNIIIKHLHVPGTPIKNILTHSPVVAQNYLNLWINQKVKGEVPVAPTDWPSW